MNTGCDRFSDHSIGLLKISIPPLVLLTHKGGNHVIPANAGIYTLFYGEEAH